MASPPGRRANDAPRFPPDIDAALEKLASAPALPDASTPIDRFDEPLQALFANARVVNLTEFDYGRAYRYRIVLSDDVDAASLATKTFARAVERSGRVETMTVALSLLVRYALVQFVEYEWQDGEIDEVWNDEPGSVAQMSALATLLSWLEPFGFRLLDPALASETVPHLATDLCDEGEATVADCLFFG